MAAYWAALSVVRLKSETVEVVWPSEVRLHRLKYTPNKRNGEYQIVSSVVPRDCFPLRTIVSESEHEDFEEVTTYIEY